MIVHKLTFEEYTSIYSKVPRLCIDLIIIKEQKILLIEREIDPGRGLWHLPGGTLLRGESIVSGAKRIAKEETGLEINGLDLIDIMEFENESGAFFHTVSQVYKVSVFEGKVIGGEQGRNIRFFDMCPQKIIEEQFVLLNKLFRKLPK